MKCATPPGPKSRLPFVGSELSILRFARDPLNRMSTLFAEYGDVVSLDRKGGARIFSSIEDCRGVIFGRGPEFLRTVELDPVTFHRSATSGRMYPHGEVDSRREALLEWGTGLFAVNEEEHARHRRLLNPAFSRSRVESWIPTFVEVTDRISSAWANGDIVDLHDAMKEITLRIATRSLFGEEMGRDAPIAQAQDRSLAALISPGALAARFDLPGLPYRRFLNEVNRLNRESHALVDRRRAAGAAGDDLLSTLIRESDASSHGLSNGEVVGHLGVLMAASHETTAFACSLALVLLAQHPSVASNVVEEIRGSAGIGTFTAERLRNLPTLDAVINETLRLLPPAPWTSRETTKDTQVCEFDVGANVEVIPSIFHTQRMPEIWPSAAAFDPTRWEKAEPSPYEFNPFGGGPRMCIGRNFAMMEIRAILTRLLENFRFEPVTSSRIDPCMSITMAFRSGAPTRIRPSDGRWEAGWAPVSGEIHHYIELNH